MKRGCVMLGFLIDCDCDVNVIVIVSFPLVSSVPPPEQPLLLCTVSFPCCAGEGLLRSVHQVKQGERIDAQEREPLS